MKEVLLLGKNDWDPQKNFETASYDNQTTGQGNRSSELSLSKLKRLIQIPPGRHFPSNLFDD